MNKIISSNTARVYYICGEANGKKYWYFLFVSPSKMNLFSKAPANDEVDLADFGSVIKSGEGEAAPAEIIAQMRDNYNCTF